MDSFSTKRLNLRRITEDDFDFFVTLIQDDAITRYFVNFRDLDNPQEDFTETILKQQNHGNLFLVICKKDNIPIGILNAFYTANGSWLVEYALHEKHRKYGYMTELISQICTRDFEFMSIFKTNQNSIASLLFEIHPDNIHSRQVILNVVELHNLLLEIDGNSYEIIL